MQYIRVEIDTDPIDLAEFLYNKDEENGGWNLTKPNLILSVTGIKNLMFSFFKLVFLESNI